MRKTRPVPARHSASPEDLAAHHVLPEGNGSLGIARVDDDMVEGIDHVVFPS